MSEQVGHWMVKGIDIPLMFSCFDILVQRCPDLCACFKTSFASLILNLSSQLSSCVLVSKPSSPTLFSTLIHSFLAVCLLRNLLRQPYFPSAISSEPKIPWRMKIQQNLFHKGKSWIKRGFRAKKKSEERTRDVNNLNKAYARRTAGQTDGQM